MTITENKETNITGNKKTIMTGQYESPRKTEVKSGGLQGITFPVSDAETSMTYRSNIR